MSTSKIVVRWDEGLHLRVAALLVRIAKKYRSAVQLRAGEQAANAGNIMQLLLLSASPGTVLIVEADGVDEEQAIHEVIEFFASDGMGGESNTGEATVTHRAAAPPAASPRQPEAQPDGADGGSEQNRINRRPAAEEMTPWRNG